MQSKSQRGLFAKILASVCIFATLAIIGAFAYLQDSGFIQNSWELAPKHQFITYSAPTKTLTFYNTVDAPPEQGSTFDGGEVTYLWDEQQTNDILKENHENNERFPHRFWDETKYAENVRFYGGFTGKHLDHLLAYRQNVINLDLSGLDLSKTESMNSFLQGVGSYQSQPKPLDIDFSTCVDSNTPRLSDGFDYVFSGANAKTINLGDMDLSRITSMNGTFYNVGNLQTIYVAPDFNENKRPISLERANSCFAHSGQIEGPYEAYTGYGDNYRQAMKDSKRHYVDVWNPPYKGNETAMAIGCEEFLNGLFTPALVVNYHDKDGNIIEDISGELFKIAKPVAYADAYSPNQEYGWWRYEGEDDFAYRPNVTNPVNNFHTERIFNSMRLPKNWQELESIELYAMDEQPVSYAAFYRDSTDQYTYQAVYGKKKISEIPYTLSLERNGEYHQYTLVSDSDNPYALTTSYERPEAISWYGIWNRFNDGDDNYNNGDLLHVEELRKDSRTLPLWTNYSQDSRTKVIRIEDGDVPIVPNMFRGFYECQEVVGAKNLDFDGCEDLTGMFRTCRNLSSLDLSDVKATNAKSTDSMFAECLKLSDLNMTGFETSDALTDTQHMFYYSAVVNLDLRSMDTSNVKNMRAMFWDCRQLESIEQDFDTSNVLATQHMFRGCNKLASLDASNFDMSNVIDFGYMFDSCTAMTSIDTSHFDTSSGQYFNYMFNYCYQLAYLDISSFDFSHAHCDERYGNHSFRDSLYGMFFYVGCNDYSKQFAIISDHDNIFDTIPCIANGQGTDSDMFWSSWGHSRFNALNGNDVDTSAYGMYIAKNKEDRGWLTPKTDIVYHKNDGSTETFYYHNQSLPYFYGKDDFHTIGWNEEPGLSTAKYRCDFDHESDWSDAHYNRLAKKYPFVSYDVNDPFKPIDLYESTTAQAYLACYYDTDDRNSFEDSVMVFGRGDAPITYDVNGVQYVKKDEKRYIESYQSTWYMNEFNDFGKTKNKLSQVITTDDVKEQPVMFYYMGYWNGIGEVFNNIGDKLNTIDLTYVKPATTLVDGSTNIHDTSEYGPMLGDNVYLSFNEMFQWSQICEIDGISGWDVSLYRNFSNMFRSCRKLEHADISGWNSTHAADSMGSMFKDCVALKTVDVTGCSFTDTCNDIDGGNCGIYANEMFAGCKNLEEIIGDETLYMPKAMFNSAFAECDSLKSLDLSGLGQLDELKRHKDTGNFDGWSYIGELCNGFCGPALEYCDLSGLLINSSPDCGSTSSNWGLFDRCRNLKTLKVNGASRLLTLPEPAVADGFEKVANTNDYQYRMTLNKKDDVNFEVPVWKCENTGEYFGVADASLSSRARLSQYQTENENWGYEYAKTVLKNMPVDEACETITYTASSIPASEDVTCAFFYDNGSGVSMFIDKESNESAHAGAGTLIRKVRGINKGLNQTVTSTMGRAMLANALYGNYDNASTAIVTSTINEIEICCEFKPLEANNLFLWVGDADIKGLENLELSQCVFGARGMFGNDKNIDISGLKNLKINRLAITDLFDRVECGYTNTFHNNTSASKALYTNDNVLDMSGWTVYATGGIWKGDKKTCEDQSLYDICPMPTYGEAGFNRTETNVYIPRFKEFTLPININLNISNSDDYRDFAYSETFGRYAEGAVNGVDYFDYWGVRDLTKQRRENGASTIHLYNYYTNISYAALYQGGDLVFGRGIVPNPARDDMTAPIEHNGKILNSSWFGFEEGIWDLWDANEQRVTAPWSSYWGNRSSEIKTISFDVDGFKIRSLRSICKDYTNLESADFSTIDFTPSEKYDSMREAFYNTPRLTDLKLPENVDATNIHSVRSMFYNSAVTRVDFSTWTWGDEIEYGQGMFENSDIEYIDMSTMPVITDNDYCDQYYRGDGFNGGESMFRGCQYLKTVILPDGFVNSCMHSTNSMFWECKSLQTITGLETWDMSNVTTMLGMFMQVGRMSGANSDVLRGIEHWDVSKVTMMQWLFCQCGYLNLDLSAWDTRNVNAVGEFFKQPKPPTITLPQDLTDKLTAAGELW